MLFPYSVESESERMPIATYVLLAVNTLVFVAGQLLPNDTLVLVLHRYGFAREQSRFPALLSYMFLHGNWLHLIGNMYYLWLFGRALEQVLGTARFVVFYLVGGMVAVLTHAALVTPQIADVPCVGASGAISAVLGGFAVMLPYTYVQTVVFLVGGRPLGAVRLRAWFVLGFWFLLQLGTQWFLADPANPGGVAYGAHIGGFLFGWAVLGVAGTMRSAKAESAAIVARGAMYRAAARIQQGAPLEHEDLQRPEVERMLFLKSGRAASRPEVLNDWLAGMELGSGTMPVAASVLLRAHTGVTGTGLAGVAEGKGAEALAELGHAQLAAACLLDRLETVAGPAAQDLLAALGLIVWRHLSDPRTASWCLERAVALAPETPTAAKATRILGLIRDAAP